MIQKLGYRKISAIIYGLVAFLKFPLLVNVLFFFTPPNKNQKGEKNPIAPPDFFSSHTHDGILITAGYLQRLIPGVQRDSGSESKERHNSQTLSVNEFD